ncbi:CHASE domain-containing protein [uncultured Oceanisphaera sp.]|uniref:CHASE domain-containing protein n=1 Tax=uncultured Oceanisphaera sp. TaxID=353858 RepID=UPI0026222D57|nr:CHASE domain-containing protein [uncultured Oceanisphaera sp.]
MKRHLDFIWNRWSLLTLAIGLVVSVLLAWQLQQSNEQGVDKAVTDAANKANTAVINRLELYQYGLRGARGAVLSAGDERLNRELFHRYSLSRDIDREFPGARGFGFIRRVPQAGVESFVGLARADGWPDFRVKALNPHDRERYVIQYVEPVARNIEAVGLDIGSEKNRRAAADAAMRTGKVRLTGPITLVQASGKPLQSFLILMPIYRDGMTPATEAERVQQVFGWSYAPLLMEEVLSSLHLDADTVQLELFDVTEPGNQEMFYSNASETSAAASDYTETTRFDVYGRRWESRFSVSHAFVIAQHRGSPLQFLLLGALISLLAALLIGTSHLSRERRRQVLDEQARLAAIVESSADGIIGKTLDGVITSWNRGAEQLFGYPARLAIGQEMASLVVPEDRQQEEADLLARVRHGEHIPHFETVRQRQDGSRFHVSVTVSPIRNSAGQVIGASKTVRDITSQKETEARVLELNSNLEAQVARRTGELTAARDQLLMAADVAELGVWTWSLADNSLDWNDKMFELYGYPVSLREQGVGYEHWYARLHPDDAEYAVSSMQAAVEGIGSYDPVFRLKLPGGDVRYMQAGAQIERDAEGQVIRVTGINLDITAQRELETGLRQAKARADEASAAKSIFLSNMSHEIRTPLNAVLGLLQLVQQTALDPRQNDYIGKAYKAARSLLGLLNDILDYSKIEAGKLQLEPHLFELEELMQEMAVVLSGNLGTKPVELMFDFAPSLPGSLIGDRLRLQQVLINLAGNAIKFTEQGEVVVRLSELGRGAEWVQLRVEVTDTGIGIAEDKLEYILEGFNQAEASTARRFGGTGLGLVISKRLLALMGSELHVRSTPGEGSCFWFEVTFGLEETVPSLVTAEVSERPLRVLVVDDHQVSADILARVVRQQGWQVNTANSGQAALLEVEQNNHYDLVLMDWAMPDMNGMEVATQIRTLVRDHLPTVIMITAYGREQLAEAQQTANPPFTDFLTKPVTPQQLITTVQRALAGDTLASDHKTFPAPSLQRLTGLRLLVVEDNALNRQVAAELLRGEGASVELAEGGLEGVGKVVEAPTSFDMVLMDMQMPDIDGLEATRRIRAHGSCQELPILAMTANVTLADQRACLAAGMNAHIGKPVDIEQLVAVLLSFGADKGNRVAEPSVAHQADPCSNIDAIIRRFGGDVRLYQRLLTGFEQDAVALFDELERHVLERDRVATAATLHTFRGAAATMGAATFASRLLEFEQQFGDPNTEQVFSVLNTAALSALKAQLAQERAALLAAVTVPAPAESTADLSPDALEVTGDHTKEQFEQLLALLDAGNMAAIDCVEQLSADMPDTHRETLAAEVQNLNFTVASNMVRELLEAL